MTSVVDTSVKHFSSDMAGAPILNGVAGSLISMLNACLITGFDTKAATSLVVSGGIATLSFTGAHSATVGTVVLVAGSSIAALNGEQKITVIESGFVRFATAAADGVASGTISFKMAPAGWLQPFVGTNLATYKSADPAGTGMILRVNDTGTYQGRVVGYEQMTDVNTGTGPFPTPAMSSGGGYWAKSWEGDATAVPWSLFSDGRLFYIGIAANYSSSTRFTGQIVRGFGDMLARRPGGDPYSCVLNHHANGAVIPAVAAMQGSFSSGSYSGCAFPRNFTGLGSAVSAGCYPNSGGLNEGSGCDGRFGDFPPPFGELMLSNKTIANSSIEAPRADVPGLYHLPQGKVFDTFKTGNTIKWAGRTVMLVNVTEIVGAASSVTVGALAFDITGPWR